MLSGSVRATRACLSCRLAIQQRASGLYNRSNVPRAAAHLHRTYASDGHRYSKEEVKSLILGTSTKAEKKPSADSSIGSKPPAQQTERHDEADEHLLDSTQSREPNEISDPIEPVAEDADNTAASNSSEQVSALESILGRLDQQEDRSFRHELLHQQNLSVDALGKPVEAIILKNPNKMRRSRKQIPMMEEEQAANSSAASLNWQDVLRESQPSKDPATEALDNIEELRPLNTSIMSRKEFDDLSMYLVDGFTQGQLVEYIAARHTVAKPQFDATKEYTWATRYLPWESVENDAPTSLAPKTKLANAIIRKLWDISIREQVEGLGRAVVWMQPNVYQQLAITSHQVLETLRKDLLDPTNNEKIAANSDEACLSIHSRKSTVSVILARLDEFAQSIVSHDISTQNIKRENLSRAALNDLGRLTETALTYQANKQTVTVSWIASPDRPTPTAAGQLSPTALEDPACIVRRLLLVGTGENTEDTASQVITSASKAKKNVGKYLAHNRERRSMSWRDKLQAWFRYVSPIEKPTTDSDVHPLQLASRVSLPSLGNEEQLSATTSATFGHVLNSEPTSGKRRRILSPVVPHPAALTTVAANEQQIQQSASIILNFSPEPTDASPASKPTAPQVHLRLPIGPETDLSRFRLPANSTLHATIRNPTTDLLLPQESVDVRISQKQLLNLDINQPPLQQFLAASEFNLLQGRLRTPSQTTFTLPARWLLNSKPTDPETQEVPYLFMGLEIHQTVEAPWQGHTLRYTSIEAGQHGGQRQELSLHPTDASSDFDRRQFLQAVDDMATGKALAWNDGYALVQSPEDGEYSAELMEGGGVAYREEDLAEELPSVGPGGEVTEVAAAGEEVADKAGAVDEAAEQASDGGEASSTQKEGTE